MTPISLTRRGFLGALAAPAFAAEGLRITAVRATPVAVNGPRRLTPPSFSSDFDPARWRWRGPFAQLTSAVIVSIETSGGVTGFGLGAGGRAAAAIIEDHFAPLLIGTDPRHIELLWDQLFSASSFYGRKGVAVMALSGVDLALWDIAGKHAGRPVHDLLGGATKEKVPAYYTGTQTAKALALGFERFKIPLREGVAEGKEGMRRTEALLNATRKLIGDSAELMVECNSLWDVPYTLEMDRRLAGLRIAFFEEPLLPDDLNGYTDLCARVRHSRIASGEHEYTRFGFDDLIRRHAVHVLQPDITWSGGLTELRRIAALAATHALPLLPHRGGSCYSLSYILATPHIAVAESFGVVEEGNELLAAMTPRFEKGFYYPSEEPGFGARLSTAMVERYRRL